MSSHRIISLLPAATEIIYQLGLEKNLVGVSSDCDFPKEVKEIPKVTNSVLPANLSSLDIDQKVKNLEHQGKSIFHIDQNLLASLHPNLVISQELCAMCAISFTQVKKAAKVLKGDYTLLSLEPESIENVLENIKLIATHTGSSKNAGIIIANLKQRLAMVKNGIKTRKKPKVLIFEWLDPMMVAGHWVPEMVEIAGGKMLVTKKGGRSEQISWDAVLNANPDVIIIAPCGFSIQRTKKEFNLISTKPKFHSLKAVVNKQIYLMDGDAYLTRPGPRLIDGTEILTEILHPERFSRNYDLKDWLLVK